MSADKYPSIFSRQIEAIVYIITSGEVIIVGGQILAAVTTRIVVDKSTDHAKPHSICFFLPQYQR